MLEEFQRALFPPSVRIYGVSLKRLTLWHLSILEAIGSPFLANDAGQTLTRGDLLTALKICALAPGVGGEVLQIKASLADILRGIRFSSRSKKAVEHFERSAAAFSEWLRDSRVHPRMWPVEKDTGSRPISAPLAAYRVGQLLSIGFSHAEAWGLSPGYAAWLILTHAESEAQSVRFWTDEDEQLEAQLMSEPELTDEEQIAIARRELPESYFNKWLADRKNNVS